MTRNYSLMRRFHTYYKSKVIHTIGHIQSTIFEQPKALSPFTYLEVTFKRNKEDFLLLSKLANPSYWLQIQQMVLYIWKMELKESLAYDIERVALAGKNYLYPIRRVKIATYQKGPTVEAFSQTDILPGEEQLPRCIFIAVVHHEAVHWSYTMDPFNYQPFGVKNVGLKMGEKRDHTLSLNAISTLS